VGLLFSFHPSDLKWRVIILSSKILCFSISVSKIKHFVMENADFFVVMLLMCFRHGYGMLPSFHSLGHLGCRSVAVFDRAAVYSGAKMSQCQTIPSLGLCGENHSAESE
jgi:hypothetical protein